jgi:3-dehydroquinate dehydratase type I
VPVVAETVKAARRQYLRAARKGCWTEVRLDYLKRPDLKQLFRTRPGPVIATNRLATEGGRWKGTEEERRRLLEEALELGVNFLDVELATDATWRQELYRRRGDTGLILSWHDFSGTPDLFRLEAIMAEMLAEDAQILKVVTWARKPEDNLLVLSLISPARALGREIIAFCLGPLGKWSRIAAPSLGSYLTYAPFSRRGASAPGQLTVNEMKRLWRALKG